MAATGAGSSSFSGHESARPFGMVPAHKDGTLSPLPSIKHTYIPPRMKEIAIRLIRRDKE